MIESIDVILASPVLIAMMAGLVGLMVGSFLNVVIYRLPVMMHRGWRKECIEYLLGVGYLKPDPSEVQAEEERFDLIFPFSRCPSCGVGIKPYQNIPVISYLCLKGKCANCSNPISMRYPLIEALTAILSFAVAWHFGYTVQGGFALLLTWVLVALSFIDIDHQLLPDDIIYPTLWLGVFLSLFGVFTNSHASIIGAVAGYLSLWSVYKVFKLITGKEGMGFGDFKLLALFGAWLGWQYLPLIILLSSVVGAVIGVGMIVFADQDRSKQIPFGPYLAAAAWIALLWGHELNQFYLDTLNL